MKRVFVMSSVALLFGSLWQALALSLPMSLNSFLLPPIILVFCLHYFNRFETSMVSLICGLIADVLGGFLIGPNMLLMLAIAFLLSGKNELFGRKDHQLKYQVIVISFVYRVLFIAVYYSIMAGRSNISFLHLLVGPVIDCAMSLLFYSMLSRVLVYVKAVDHSDFMSNSIGLGR